MSARVSNLLQAQRSEVTAVEPDAGGQKGRKKYLASVTKDAERCCSCRLVRANESPSEGLSLRQELSANPNSDETGEKSSSAVSKSDSSRTEVGKLCSMSS